MKVSSSIYIYFFIASIFLSSCSTDVKIGKGNYYGKKFKVINGQLGGLNYVMLVGHGKNKYPLTVDFRDTRKPFFIIKTTITENKFVTWHCVTDTTNNQFNSFGVALVSGVGLNERTFMPISSEDKKALNDFSDLLTLKRQDLKMPKDSINRLIGWVKVAK
jgi:hypothetical protein